MKFTAESKFFLGIFIVTAVVVGLAVWFFSKPAPVTVIARETLVPQDAHTKGNKNASVYLVEFSDFQCPACAAFAPAVESLMQKYPDTLLVVYRHFPLPQHTFAKQAAYAAESSGTFWDTASFLFKNQNNFSDAFFATYPKPTGEIIKKVDADLALAQQLNLKGTPSFFLNGILLTNLITPDDLIKAVEKAVNQR